jgi:hypothetical protein
MSLVASAYLDQKIAEVQSFLDEDPECAPLQRKLEELIRQRRHDDLRKVSYRSGRNRSSVMLSYVFRAANFVVGGYSVRNGGVAHECSLL